MKISELPDGVKGLEVKGRVKLVFEYKHIQPKENDEWDAFHSQGIIIEDIYIGEARVEEDSIAVGLTHCPELTKLDIGKEIILHKCELTSYVNKKGETVKKLKSSKIDGIEPKQPEKASVIEKPTTPLPGKTPDPYTLDGIFEVVTDIKKLVNELVDWIMVENNPVFRTPKEKPVKKLQDISVEDNHAEVMDELTPEQLADIKYNENGLHIEAVYKEELNLWDITLYDIPAKSSFPPLPLEISGFAQSKSGRLTIIGQIISRLEKDTKNQKLILLIREKCE